MKIRPRVRAHAVRRVLEDDRFCCCNAEQLERLDVHHRARLRTCAVVIGGDDRVPAELALEPPEVHVDPAARRARDDRALQVEAVGRSEVFRDARPQLLGLDQRQLVRIAALVQRVALERLADEVLEVVHRAPRPPGRPDELRHSSWGSSCPCSRYSHSHPARDGDSVSMIRPSKSKRNARMATAMQSTRVAILGVDVGGTFTDAVFLDGGELRTAKVPSAVRQEESVLEAARRGRRPSASSGSRTGRPSRRTRCSNDAVRARRSSGMWASSICCTYGARPRASLPAVRAAARAARPARAVVRRAWAARAGRRAGAARPRLTARCRRRRGGRGLSAVRVPRLVARGCGREALRERLPGAHVSRRTRCAGDARVRARARRRWPTRISRRAARYLRALADGAREAGLPAPLVMQSSGGVIDRRRRGASRDAARLRAGGRRRRRRPRGRRRAASTDAIAFDMGGTAPTSSARSAARAAPCRARRRRGADPPPDGRPPHRSAPGAARSRGRRRRRDPRRAALGGRDSGPARYGAGGGADRDRCEPPARYRLPARSCRRARARPRQRRRARGRARSGRRASDVDVVNAEMVRALRVVTVERGHDPRDSRSSRSAARARCTRARSRRSSGSRPCSCRRRRASCRRSASGWRRAARPRRSRMCVRSQRWTTFRADGEADLRVPRPVVRADGAVEAELVAERSSGRTRSGTAMRILRARSSSSPCAPRGCRRGARACRSRAGRASVSGPELVELPGATCGCRPAGTARRTTTGRWCSTR